MNRSVHLLSIELILVSSLAAIGCAGTLTDDEITDLQSAHSTVGGSGGAGPVTNGTPTTTAATTATTTTTAGTGGGTTGAGGSGGSPPNVDMCILKSFASCQNKFCHGSPSAPAAGLSLLPADLTTKSRSLIDKPNVGVQAADDANGCGMGLHKLIDSANPMNSFILTKLHTTPLPADPPAACGSWMPEQGTFTDADRTCVVNWITSVIAAK